MGKASSSKKVARASRASGRPGASRSYGWSFLIGTVVVVGMVLIVLSRGKTADAIAPKLGDHWHAAYGIYDCDHFFPNLTDQLEDKSGLHSHGDGLMHMHPFGTAYTGKGANLGNWGKTTGFELTDTSMTAAGISRKNGDTCKGKKGKLQLKVWDGTSDKTGHLVTKDLADYNPQEFTMWTLAFVPAGADIPKPPAAAIEALQSPADVQGATPSSSPPDTSNSVPSVTVAPGTTPTTSAGDTSSSSAPSSPSTTVPTSSP